MKFGEYLLGKGKIRESELEDAIKVQQKQHVILGVLAKREGLLNNAQLSMILDHQRINGGLFGELAIELKLLNKHDVTILLDLQEKERDLLGDILVLYGAISRDDMENELKRFHEIQGAKIEWDEKYSVGISIIDDEHKKFFGIINKVVHAKEHKEDPNEINEILLAMNNYALMHFKTEESYMEEFNFPEYQSHKEEHNRFSSEIIPYTEKVIGGNYQIASDILEYLKQWLVKHIQVTDRQFIDCFKKNGLN